VADDLVFLRPFSNGGEYRAWRAHNCERCALYAPGASYMDSPCPLDAALAFATITGDIADVIAIDYGAAVRGAYCDLPAECPKRVPHVPDAGGRDGRA
jgi:hypothetical protein